MNFRLNLYPFKLRVLFSILILSYSYCLFGQNQIDFHENSKSLLLAIQEESSTKPYVNALANATLEALENNLNTEEKKLAFWINTYNAFIQIRLNQNPSHYKDRSAFFKSPMIDIAGEKMSFAQIEHGIIRRSQIEYFLGYISNPFASKREKKLRLNERDFRIHFALNCGAKSCPPVAVYNAQDIDDQLNYIAKKFLQEFSTYDVVKKEVHTTSLFSWFRGDFGGTKGIKKILRQYGITPDLDFKAFTTPYDWTLHLNNFIDIPSQ